jgi:uncharacterized protein (UPF0335 family)
MPDDPRISQSLELLEGELSQERLERLAQAFEALAQDRSQTLAFFVLQNVCERLVSALEGEAVSVERFEELTAGIADQITDVLRDLQRGNCDFAKLELLVVSLFQNLGLYRH